jgi:hypothetical protein
VDHQLLSGLEVECGQAKAPYRSIDAIALHGLLVERSAKEKSADPKKGFAGLGGARYNCRNNA